MDIDQRSDHLFMAGGLSMGNRQDDLRYMKGELLKATQGLEDIDSMLLIFGGSCRVDQAVENMQRFAWVLAWIQEKTNKGREKIITLADAQKHIQIEHQIFTDCVSQEEGREKPE